MKLSGFDKAREGFPLSSKEILPLTEYVLELELAIM